MAAAITIEQYQAFALPEGFRDELINGKIIPDNLYRLLTKAAGKKHRVGQRMNLRFPDVNSMPSPDVFVIEMAEWKRARLQDVYPEGSKVLLAVEVLSPSNRKSALQSKINIYHSHRIECWLVDPKQQEVKVYRGAKTLTASVKSNSSVEWNGKSIPVSAIFRLPG